VYSTDLDTAQIQQVEL